MSASSSSRDRLRNPVESEMSSSRERALSRAQLRSLQIENQLREAREQLDQYRDLYLRQRADMENYSKAKDREISQIIKNASREVVKNLLPILDSLDSAIANSKDGSNLIPVQDQTFKILGTYGFKIIEAKGKKFDPYLHEVIAVNQSEEDGIVLEEIQRGYKLNDEVLRTSKVIVGKKGEE